MVEPEPVRSLVFGFLSVSEALGRARLVCRGWSRTLAAWDTVTSVRALQAALRPRALELTPTLTSSLTRVNVAGRQTLASRIF